MLRHRLSILFVALMLTLSTFANAQTKLQLTVHTGHGVNGYDVNSTMISGDKDMSVIRGLPPGRQPITTVIKPDSRRDEVYALMRFDVPTIGMNRIEPANRSTTAIR